MIDCTPNRRRVLVDTNIWRYLVNNDEVESLYHAAKGRHAVILACPAVLYEMLRLDDLPLQKRLVKAICRSRWLRMMPEAFEESMEFLAEISRLRPQWILARPDERLFTRLHSDWSGRRGVWWRARTNPTEAARVLRIVEGDLILRARDDASRLRADMRHMATFDTVNLARWTTTFPLKPPGWKGDPVETWRATTMGYYIEGLFDSRQPPAAREWLEPLVDLSAMRSDLASFARLMLYETQPDRMPRSWLRWALHTLQATRTTSPGTPVDAQIGSYLVDADFFVTADRAFLAITERLRREGRVPVAEPVRATERDALAVLINLLKL